MQKDNINAALNLLTNSIGHDILPLCQKTISQLTLKRPQKSCASDDILINGRLEKIHKQSTYQNKRGFRSFRNGL